MAPSFLLVNFFWTIGLMIKYCILRDIYDQVVILIVAPSMTPQELLLLLLLLL